MRPLSYFQFYADLDDLRTGHGEICGRALGVSVHEREQGLAPGRHFRVMACRDNGLAAKIIGHVVGIAQADLVLRTGKFDRLGHIWRFHKTKMDGEPGDPVAERLHFDPLLIGNPRTVVSNRADDIGLFLQHLIVAQMMGQQEGNARPRARQKKTRAFAAEGRAQAKAGKERIHVRAQLLPDAPRDFLSPPPCQHDEGDREGEQQWKPAAFKQFQRIGAEKDKVDDQKCAVHWQDNPGIVTPAQGDQRREHRRDRHQQRHCDSIGSRQRSR